MSLPGLHHVPLPKLPPLQEVRAAVEEDVRGLWAGVEALGVHEPAANEEPPAPAERPWRPPLGWISLAAVGALLAGLGLAQIEVRRHLWRPAPALQVQVQKRIPPRTQKKLRRVRVPNRTDFSRSG